MGISLDGGTPATHDKIRGSKGLFNKIIDTISLLLSYKIPVSIITCVHRGNIDELDCLKKLLTSIGVYAWQIQPALNSGRFKNSNSKMLDKQELKKLADFIGNARRENDLKVYAGDNLGFYSSTESEIRDFCWKGCPAGISTLGIRSNGDVVGCISMHDSMSEGNLKDNCLNDIWTDRTKFIYNRQFDKEKLQGDCKDCLLGSICKGGCRVSNYSLTDNFHNNQNCLRYAEDEVTANYLVI